MRKGIVVLLVSIALVVGFTAGAQTSHNGPSTLSQVRAGMTSEAIVSGLTDRYTIKKLDESIWGVYSKSSNEEGTILLNGGKVTAAMQNLTTQTGAEVVALFQKLHDEIYFKAQPTGNNVDAIVNKRQIPAVIQLDELHVSERNYQRITLQLSGGNLQITFDEPSSVSVSKAWW